MKKLLFTLAISVTVTSLMAQTANKPATTPAKKPATTTAAKKPATSAPAPALKNSLDSFSYAIGLSIANFYKAQGVEAINTQLVVKALNDFKANKPLLTEEQINTTIVNFMQAARSEKAAGNKKAGQAFLAENKKKPGVVTLPSGLQYLVLQEGNGPKPTLSDNVKCHYVGSFIDGSVFESSYNNNQPATFGVGQVIRGWTEALQLMPVGSKWRLFIPSDLAYGDIDRGAIPPGSTLIFDVELLEIVK
jgi:FKBP-type peptidyl-prolyl cis-trans isomerase FklB